MIRVLPRIKNVTVERGRGGLGRDALVVTRREPARGPGVLSTIMVEEKLVEGAPPWVPVAGRTCRKVDSDPETEFFECT